MIEIILLGMGIFVITAFSVVIFINRRHEIPMGYWPLIGAASAFMLLAEIFELMGNREMHFFLVIVSLIIFFIIALLKYWDTLRIIELPD